ncbi:MAG: sodium ion-translocating decarboxylase subunit beta [Dehalococcoidia bacterium]
MVSEQIFGGFLGLVQTPAHLLMMVLGGILLYLGIKKNIEPVLLLPIGLGVILGNIPFSGVHEEGVGIFWLLNDIGLRTEIFPLLIFIGIGAMIDFGPLLERPYTVLLGAAAQFGIFGTLLVALVLGFPLNEAAAIGIIGSADGPTSIYVAALLAPKLLAPIAVAAYSYMALVPIIQPPIMRLLTTDAERKTRMTTRARPVSNTAKVLFPVVVILIAGLIAPMSTPLIGFLMFGNLLRVSGVVERLSNSAQNELVNITTILLGITVGSTMTAGNFLNPDTVFTLRSPVLIFFMGLVAFALDTGAGLFFGKIMYYISGKKINPLIGAAGISAFPMSARVVQREGLRVDPHNHLLMYAVGANTAGQIASVVAGGAVIALLRG